MDDLSAPPSKSAVSTFFMRLSQRYQSLLGKIDKMFAFPSVNRSVLANVSRERWILYGAKPSDTFPLRMLLD